jgi:hypothetical protein
MYVFDALLFSTGDCRIVLSLYVIFVKKSSLVYGNSDIVNNCYNARCVLFYR